MLSMVDASSNAATTRNCWRPMAPMPRCGACKPARCRPRPESRRHAQAGPRICIVIAALLRHLGRGDGLAEAQRHAIAFAALQLFIAVLVTQTQHPRQGPTARPENPSG